MKTKEMKHLLCVVSMLAAGIAVAADFYVNNRTGSDENDGRAADRAFATFAKAMPNVRAGDTLHVAPGKVYHESIIVRHCGTPESPVVIKGNGAVLSGLSPLPAVEWEDKGNGLFRFPYASSFGNPQVTLGPCKDRIVTVVASPENLKAGEATWRRKDGFYFRVAEGKSLEDYDLHGFVSRGPVYHSGVYLENKDFVTVEDVTSECFANDGFNVQLSSHGLVFRNVVGRYNGDDGFSVHEDVQACVYNGMFHHNDFGIQDVNASQTLFFGCSAVSNRTCGVDLQGGLRVFRGLRVLDNRHDQICVHGSKADHYGIPRTDPMLRGLAYFTDTAVEGGNGMGLYVDTGAAISARNLSIRNVECGLVVQGEASIVNGTVSGCRKRDVDTVAAKSFVSTGFPKEKTP